MASTIQQITPAKAHSISELYRAVRARTMQIVAPLEIEDYVIQTADFMSPPRWHIGHTSWFFETLLQAHQPGYKIYSEEYLFYFNSYYEGLGERIARPKRGTRSRPTVRDTIRYRNHVDVEMLRFLDTIDEHSQREAVLSLVRLGLEHEMQHQELLVYDIKHLLGDQFDAPIQPAPVSSTEVTGMAEIEGGMFRLGYGAQVQNPETKGQGPSHFDFAFDNEKPAHQVFLHDFAIDRALVSNGDYLEFMRAGGYQNFRWWFSEGWETVNREQWAAPMYWELHDGQWMIRDFTGLNAAASKANEPVSHVSFFEASAFAKWAGKRLPTEAEWERAACGSSHNKPSRPAGAAVIAPYGSGRRNFPWGSTVPTAANANLFENGLWSVATIGSYPAGQNDLGCQQLIGDVWEWTTSDYVPYPGFKSEFDEYNDKWFVNQKVLRGGSFATPQLHIRSTYRNFFHAHERWMVSGFRCARNL